MARLGKVGVYQHYYGPVLAYLLVLRTDIDPLEAALGCGMNALAVAGLVTATSALDDVTGYRNGSDRRNYSPADETRDMARKPLLAGTASVQDAFRLAAAGQAVALAMGLGAFAVAGRYDPVALGIFTGAWALSCQYSWGAKLSYRWAGGEALLAFATAASLLWPMLTFTDVGRQDGVVQAVLLAVWMLNVSLYSNMHDAEGDRAVGRRTLAAMYGRRVNHAVVAGLFTSSVLLTTGYAAAGGLPLVALVLFFPAWYQQGRQFWLAVKKNQPMQARKLGFSTFNRGVAALVVANLLMVLYS